MDARPSRVLLPLVAGALFWPLFVWRWFDVGGRARPAWLEAIPPALLGLPALAVLLGWLLLHARTLVPPRPAYRTALWACVALAVLFRLPFVAEGAAGAVTPDGALSGIVMLRLLDGSERLVFVPNVPYSGSLKSHLAAVLTVFVDAPRAFAFASVLFYAAFVAGVARLASMLPGASPPVVLAAGFYAAFAPPFVTRYSLSNDGNYVEVLALGTWALVLAARGAEVLREPARSWSDVTLIGLSVGLLLGLAFWCHILAVIFLAAVVLTLLCVCRMGALPALVPMVVGWTLGDAPGLAWNLANRWESFRYLLPGGPHVGGEAARPGLGSRVLGLLADHLPVLFGQDTGYGAVADAGLRLFGALAAALFVYALLRAARAALADRDPVLVGLVLLVVVNIAVAVFALPYLPGNARYLLFLAGPASVLLASTLAPSKSGRIALAVLIAGGALFSLAQLPGTARADARWRAFVADLRAAGVRHCYTDFYLATKINFLSGEEVVCTAKLGPTTTEYFSDYRSRVEEAPSAAFVAVNSTAARKLEGHLRRVGVAFERRDLMKPVLIPARKVDPAEVFPGRTFPMR